MTDNNKYCLICGKKQRLIVVRGGTRLYETCKHKKSDELISKESKMKEQTQQARENRIKAIRAVLSPLYQARINVAEYRVHKERAGSWTSQDEALFQTVLHYVSVALEYAGKLTGER